MIVGGSMGALLQVITLGALISRTGSKKIGINAWASNNREDLALLAELFETGKVVPVIDKRYPLMRCPMPSGILMEGRSEGKLSLPIYRRG